MATDQDNYSIDKFSNGRCPNCGNEEENTIIERNSKKVQPVPPDLKAKCGKCGRKDNPGAFEWEYKKKRMTEEELEEVKRKRQEWEDKQAESVF